MIKHLVFWRLKEEALGKSGEENAKEIARLLNALPAEIPELKKLEFGMNFVDAPAAFDCALYTEFDSKEALDIYQNHPLHVEAKNFIVQVVSDRAFVDYEL